MVKVWAQRGLAICHVTTWKLKSMSAWAIRTLRRVATDLTTFQDGRRIPLDVVDTFVICLDLVYRELIALEHLGGFDANVDHACEVVRQSLRCLRMLQDEPNQIHENCTPLLQHTGCIGRPRFVIPCEQVIFLIESRFTAPQMAQILGVSLSTIRRRMADYGLSITAEYTPFTDEELDRVVEDIQRDFPMCGNQQMQGHLISRGLRVQQLRIREAQLRVDPEGSLMRRLRTVNRRQYQVPAPLSLWHIDGNHKLIR